MRRRAVRWSAKAEADLAEIVAVIAADSPQRARAFAARLLGACARLGAFPASGRKVPELSHLEPSPREIIIGDYRILYRVGTPVVEIAAVIHGRRLLLPKQD